MVYIRLMEYEGIYKPYNHSSLITQHLTQPAK